MATLGTWRGRYGRGRISSGPPLALLCLLLLGSLAAAQPRGLTRNNVTIYYDPRDEGLAKVALEAAAEALPVLENALGVSYDKPADRPPIRIDLARSQREFNRLVGEPMKVWIQGVSLGGRRHIILKALGPAALRQVTTHELTHVLLDEAAERAGAEAPRWLHEGLAKLAADDFSEGDREVLGEAVVARKLLTIPQLEEAFAGKREQVSLAYAESYTLVKYLHDLRPDGGISQLLRELALTHDLDRALLRTYGQERPKLEAAWMEQVEREYFSHGLPLSVETLIWLSMGLLFIVVVMVNARRRRVIRERLQEEDRLRRMFEYLPPEE